VKIGFIFSFPALTGGHLAVLEIGTRLVRRGHDVVVVYPSRSILSRRNDALRLAGRAIPDGALAPLYRRNDGELDWFDFPGEVLEVEELEERFLPELDAVVATAWQTAERVARFGPRTGRHVYFIQHYETWSGPAARVDATWRAPFVRIASSEWLRTLAQERFGLADVEVVPYGVDLETFHPGPSREPDGALRVGFLYHVEPWKGVADALQAIGEAGASRDLRLVSFGVFPPGRDLPPGTEYHRQPPRSELQRLYASLDVFVAASWSETGPMTVPEAMACGTCVVATDVGNVSLWSNGGEGAVVVPPRRPDLLATALAGVLDDADARRRTAERGRQLVQRFTWDAAAERFEEIVGSHL